MRNQCGVTPSGLCHVNLCMLSYIYRHGKLLVSGMWKSSAITLEEGELFFANGEGNPPVAIP